ncbi:MAG: hypothetical protein MUW57_12190 [Pseudomonas sp.]|nr:hypothetical protein [Pseudomonas sp.]
MNEDQATIAALKELLATFHVIAQRERIRSRINELEARGLSADDVIKALKAKPPVLTPKF